MDAATKPLVLDLLEWVAPRPRPYSEVMEAWRTCCPRLTIWEDAVDAGLVFKERDEAGTVVVRASAAGIELLVTERRRAATGALEREIPAMFAP